MRFALVLVAALVLAGLARAGDVQMAKLSAVEDLSLPFWCDWGYDWDERCYWDDSDRVGLGGVGDKVWRTGLRFSLEGLPPRAVLTAARLSLWYDATCVAPLRSLRPCDGSGFEVHAHPIFTPRWQSEREVEFGELAGRAVLDRGATPRWLTWDLTDLVVDWWSGAVANNGVLLKLADHQEAFDSSGPAFPSSSYEEPSLRPRLVVRYVLPCDHGTRRCN